MSKETHSPETLELLVLQLRDMADRIDNARNALLGAHVPSVQTLMADAREKGMERLHGFVDALAKSTREATMKAAQERANKSLSDLSDDSPKGRKQAKKNGQNPIESDGSDNEKKAISA